MKRLKMSERFKIPLAGDPNICFYTKRGLLLAKGYSRIVIGGRGPYIEFEPENIMMDNIYVPDHAKHKLENSLTYYHEYRSKDDSYVKLYFQRMEVSYADYKIGKWYVDPMVLKTDEFDNLLLPLYQELGSPVSEIKPTLFDA